MIHSLASMPRLFAFVRTEVLTANVTFPDEQSRSSAFAFDVAAESCTGPRPRTAWGLQLPCLSFLGLSDGNR